MSAIKEKMSKEKFDSIMRKNCRGKHSSLASARHHKEHCNKSMLIIMGDDNKFWVMKMASGVALIRAGYEEA